MQDPSKPNAPAADDPAPLSQALHIPTLVGETPAKGETPFDRNEPAPFSKALHIPTLLGETSDEKTPDEPLRDKDRAPASAGPPRAAAASQIGAPSTHPQGETGQRLRKLDRAAALVASLMVIGPLFAGMMAGMNH